MAKESDSPVRALPRRSATMSQSSLLLDQIKESTTTPKDGLKYADELFEEYKTLPKKVHHVKSSSYLGSDEVKIAVRKSSKDHNRSFELNKTPLTKHRRHTCQVRIEYRSLRFN